MACGDVEDYDGGHSSRALLSALLQVPAVTENRSVIIIILCFVPKQFLNIHLSYVKFVREKVC